MIDLKWFDVEIGTETKTIISLGRAQNVNSAIEKLNTALASGMYPEIKENGRPVFLIEKVEQPVRHTLEISGENNARVAKIAG